MSKLNKPAKSQPVFNHEGARVQSISPYLQLKRTVLATMLWESGFYESGEEIAARISNLVPQVAPEKVASLAIQARNDQHLRHVPLFVAREMARHDKHKGLVSSVLDEIIQRPDELTEFLSIYWKTNDGKKTLSAQVKKGLARAFGKFNEYSLAKYNQQNEVKLRDVLFLTHAKPSDISGAGKKAPELVKKTGNQVTYSRGEVHRHTKSVFTKLINDTLQTPDTWEVAISACKNEQEKCIEWTRLITEGKLGGLAFLRNLRNMEQCGVSRDVIRKAFTSVNFSRVLPFRFISAAKYAPHFEPELEQAMFRGCADLPKLKGKTALIIDTSPSMFGAPVSVKSEIDRFEAAAALSMLVREVCEEVSIFAFNQQSYSIPPRRGFALRDALAKTQNGWSCGGLAVEQANKEGYDRIIVLTDGEWHVMGAAGTHSYTSECSGKAQDVSPAPLTDKAYMINVANTQYGVGYGKWTSIDGWSESVIDYIREFEMLTD